MEEREIYSNGGGARIIKEIFIVFKFINAKVIKKINKFNLNHESQASHFLFGILNCNNKKFLS